MSTTLCAEFANLMGGELQHHVSGLRFKNASGQSESGRIAKKSRKGPSSQTKFVIDEAELVAIYGAARIKSITFRRHQRAREPVRPIVQAKPTKPASPKMPITPKKPRSFRAPLPSTPFDEQMEDDPFELFPEWCGPYSALRDDTTVYREQEQRVKDFIAGRPYIRHNIPLPLRQRQDIVHRCLHLGFFASPAKAARKRQQQTKFIRPESAAFADDKAFSPMDLSD